MVYYYRLDHIVKDYIRLTGLEFTGSGVKNKS